MQGRRIAVTIGMFILGSAAAAQAQTPTTRPGVPPGRYHAGKFIGFNPGRGPSRTTPRTASRTASRTRPRSATPAPTPASTEPNTLPINVNASSYLADETPTPDSEPLAADSYTIDENGDIVITDDIVLNDDSVVEAQPQTSYVVGPHEMMMAKPMIWGSASYLLWWTKGMQVPALVTTSPDGTPQDEAGVLGLRTTTTLFGGNEINDDSRSGGRFSVGYWLDPMQCRGIEITYLSLDEESSSFTGSSNDLTILARPFFDVQAGAEDSRLIAFPDLVEGSLTVQSTTDFQTAEALLRRSLVDYCGCSTDLYIGYRYAELEDLVSVVESTVSLSGPTQGATFDLSDVFETRNQFNGAQVGVRWNHQSSPLWSLELLGKIALGNTTSRTTIAGETVVVVPTGESSTQPSGLLVQDSNAGTYETSEISTITEFGVALRRQLSCSWTATFGYNFLLWTDVVRAGEQIDRSINVSQIPPGTLSGEARPAYRAETTDFWAQGLRFGLEYWY